MRRSIKIDNGGVIVTSDNQEAKQAVSRLLLEFLHQSPKLTVTHLARQIGLDRTTMSRIVHGHLLPSPPICQALAQVMNIPQQQLLKLAGHLSLISTTHHHTDPSHSIDDSSATDLVTTLNQPEDLLLDNPELLLQFYQIGSLPRVFVTFDDRIKRLDDTTPFDARDRISLFQT